LFEKIKEVVQELKFLWLAGVFVIVDQVTHLLFFNLPNSHVLNGWIFGRHVAFGGARIMQDFFTFGRLAPTLISTFLIFMLTRWILNHLQEHDLGKLAKTAISFIMAGLVTTFIYFVFWGGQIYMLFIEIIPYPDFYTTPIFLHRWLNFYGFNQAFIIIGVILSAISNIKKLAKR